MGVIERKSAIPPVPPAPRKEKAPGSAADSEGGEHPYPQNKDKDQKNGKVSATDQYTLF